MEEFVNGAFDAELVRKIERIPVGYSYSDGFGYWIGGEVLQYRWVNNAFARDRGWIEVSDIARTRPQVIKIHLASRWFPEDFNPMEPEQVVCIKEYFYFIESDIRTWEPYGSPFDQRHVGWEDDEYAESILSDLKLSDKEFQSYVDSLENYYIDQIEEFILEHGVPDGLPANIEEIYRRISISRSIT